MKQLNRWVLGCGFFLCVLGLSGCKEARLLQFKSQLQNASKTFSFNERAWVWRYPVLESEDVFRVIQLAPTQKQTSGLGKKNDYVFVQESSGVTSNSVFPPKPFMVSLFFNAQKKLTQAQFPSEATALFSSQWLPSYVAWLNRVSWNNDSQTWEAPHNLPGFESERVPSSGAFLRVLGEPNVTSTSNGQCHYTYVYDFFSDKQRISKMVVLRASFEPENKRLKTLKVTLAFADIAWEF